MTDLIKSINAATGLKLQLDSFTGGAIVPKRQLSKLLSLVNGDADKARRSAIAMKAVETRRANKAKAASLSETRSMAAVKANVTRGTKGRSIAAKKAWKTRRANAAA